MGESKSHKVYIALGTNLGNRLENLKTALKLLLPEVRVIKASPVYETPPWGYLNQADFLNQVIEAETDLTPEELLVYLKGLEAQIGRRASFKYGPRLIDLDILFYEDLILETAHLSIPHPRMHERSFVLVPLADLNPDLLHPKADRTIRELLGSTDQGGIHLFQEGAD
jgi:2-amino-4-hydroxy-6-hydroxymethyldihydropteridine diphosphokinase